MAGSSSDITQWLIAWSKGDQQALEKLTPAVYDELRRLAHHYLRKERPGHSLQTTLLAHEAYLRLVDQKAVGWHSRAHFFGIAARLIRQILVDHARTAQAQKRGDGAPRLALDEAIATPAHRDWDLIALDDALHALEKISPQQSRMIELRFFGGLSIDETAEALGVSPTTVKRDWQMAKAFLYREVARSH